MERQQTRKEERQRKFLLGLPVFMVPFITLLFWALGGGNIPKAGAQRQSNDINTTLPDANFGKEQPRDKMSYYDYAMADSIRTAEAVKNDPYARYITPDTARITGDTSVNTGRYPNVTRGDLSTAHYQDAHELRIRKQLEKLNSTLHAETQLEEIKEADHPYHPRVQYDADIERLEAMMSTANKDSENDPGMQQVDRVLERILDIQHPERVTEKLRQQSQLKKGNVFAVSPATPPAPISVLSADATLASTQIQNGFFSTIEPYNESQQNVIEAVIAQTQEVINGATVKLKLVNDVFINGVLIPRANFVYGIASLNGERLHIQVPSIHYARNIFPVALNVYDLDGLDGIYIPGAITRDVAKQSADRSIQNIGVTSLDASWQVQAAGAGVEAAKTLFSKKMKLVKVTLKAGYRVLLVDEKQKQSN